MTYAGERTIFDADSHVMELADFLDEFIEPDVRDRLRRQGLEALRPMLEDAQYKSQRRRTEDPLRRLQDKPSAYVHRHLKFTPFPGEPVGWMMEQAGADLFMFSTDYPHPEGGRDPLAKFEEELDGVDRGDVDLFYRGNMATLLGLEPAQLLG